MSGAGNDFIVLGPEQAQELGDGLREWSRRACRRGVSIGADGVLVVEPSGPGRVRVRFHNPDGAEAFCGNGSRCAARFAYLRELAGETMILETSAGDLPARVAGEMVHLALPFPLDRGIEAFHLEGVRLTGRRIWAGVPHFVAFVRDLGTAPLERWGAWLRGHPRFGSDGTNVDLAEWRPEGSLGVRTWERGVEGETLSCGTGAVAAAFAAHLEDARDRVRIVPASGIPLLVTFEGPSAPSRRVLLEGDARIVLEGTLGPESTSGFPT